MDTESISPKGFVQRVLPWLVAGGALLVFLLTLDRFVSYRGVDSLARAAGWDWHPVTIRPLYFLLTYPIRWLPAAAQVIGLNLFAAVCAALSLALLARSVALLPHDRTRDQRQFERSDFSLLTIRSAWLPPVFAALVCGLQLSFWECAVVDVGESLDLLLFAYVVRCLLEYRVDERDSWLGCAALVLGLGITNNFAMIAFLPAFVIAIVWIKGLSFFNFKFCAKMVAGLLGGLLLYLLLPAIVSFSDLSDEGFWELFKTNVGSQRTALLSFPRYLILILSLTSVVPVLFMGIKWPASFGDISAAGNFLTNLMTHVMHGVFLLACLYVAFDPAFSPRQLGLGMVFLPLYYLGALGIGYFSGYFLLVFGPTARKAWQRPSGLRDLFNRAVVGLVWLAAAAVPAGLAYHNLPLIQQGNAPALSRFGVLAGECLPAQGAVVLSDDSFRLYALQAALRQKDDDRRYLLIDTASLVHPAYHRFLAHAHPQEWPNLALTRSLSDQIDARTLVQVLTQLIASHEVYYLHPSFGYYFEHFLLRPRELVYLLQPYPTNSVSGPALTADEIRQNDEFWKRIKAEELGGLIKTAGAEAGRKKVKGEKPGHTFAVFTAAMYSRSLNYLGVELQKAGQLEKAGEYFAFALELNPENPAAFINQDFNRQLQKGRVVIEAPSEGAQKRLAGYGGNWDVILGANGPMDEPVSSFFLAKALAEGRNYRQAAQQLLRITFFTPDDLETRLALANMYVQAHLPDKALELIAQIRAQPGKKPLTTANQMALLQSEAWAYAGNGDMATAIKILRDAEDKYPQESMPFSVLVEILLTHDRASEALPVLERQLRLQPGNTGAMINSAVMKIQLHEYAEAIPYLERAAKLEPQNPYVLFNRAIANLQSDKLDAAQGDYETLERTLPKPSYMVSYGLGEIAWRKKDRRKALRHYEDYLRLAPKGVPEIQMIRDRIQKLKSGSF